MTRAPKFILLLISFLFILLHHGYLAFHAPPKTLTHHAITYLNTAPSALHFDFDSSGTVSPIGSYIPRNASTSELRAKRHAIRLATQHAWDAYERHAWGFDELRPLSNSGADVFSPGLATTIVDSLSTLYIMGGLDGRFARARDWVASSLDFSSVGRVIVFETVIRILGGLLSTFHLSGDPVFLHRAEELAARLAPAFDTPTGLPWPLCYLNDTGRCEAHHTIGDSLYLAEVGSVQLEFRALALHSRHALPARLRTAAEAVWQHLAIAPSAVGRLPGRHRDLVPFALSRVSGAWATNLVTLGAPADSYFEYLVKVWRQGGAVEGETWERFASVVDAAIDLLAYTAADGTTIVREVIPENDGQVRFRAKMDHFACYIPGAIVVGLDGLAKDETERRSRWEWFAEQLAVTCFEMYRRSPSGLAGEHVRLGERDEWRMAGGYELRPEAVEAFFYMYRHTRDEKYREFAWTVFQSIEQHCRVEGGGYATLRSARSRKPMREDVMHSFVIAETFKYLYLIFGDDERELPLGEWVFNTEAHPLLVSPGLVPSDESMSFNANRATSIRVEGCSVRSSICAVSALQRVSPTQPGCVMPSDEL